MAERETKPTPRINYSFAKQHAVIVENITPEGATVIHTANLKPDTLIELRRARFPLAMVNALDF